MTDTEILQIVNVEQEVHADIYDVSKEDLEKKREEARKIKTDNGGIICTICYIKGCRIGPMGRG